MATSDGAMSGSDATPMATDMPCCGEGSCCNDAADQEQQRNEECCQSVRDGMTRPEG